MVITSHGSELEHIWGDYEWTSVPSIM